MSCIDEMIYENPFEDLLQDNFFSNSKGDKARLISEKINRKPDGVCLKFWYHKYGLTVGTLNVYRRINNVLDTSPIWTLSGDQGNRWRQGAVTANANQDFQVVFEGVVGSSFDGLRLVDRVLFFDTQF